MIWFLCSFYSLDGQVHVYTSLPWERFHCEEIFDGGNNAFEYQQSRTPLSAQNSIYAILRSVERQTQKMENKRLVHLLVSETLNEAITASCAAYVID